MKYVGGYGAPRRYNSRQLDSHRIRLKYHNDVLVGPPHRYQVTSALQMESPFFITSGWRWRVGCKVVPVGLVPMYTFQANKGRSSHGFQI
jgi:hypothetical protein